MIVRRALKKELQTVQDKLWFASVMENEEKITGVVEGLFA